jgi:hypothetical protein
MIGSGDSERDEFTSRDFFALKSRRKVPAKTKKFGENRTEEKQKTRGPFLTRSSSPFVPIKIDRYSVSRLFRLGKNLALLLRFPFSVLQKMLILAVI